MQDLLANPKCSLLVAREPEDRTGLRITLHGDAVLVCVSHRCFIVYTHLHLSFNVCCMQYIGFWQRSSGCSICLFSQASQCFLGKHHLFVMSRKWKTMVNNDISISISEPFLLKIVKVDFGDFSFMRIEPKVVRFVSGVATAFLGSGGASSSLYTVLCNPSSYDPAHFVFAFALEHCRIQQRGVPRSQSRSYRSVCKACNGICQIIFLHSFSSKDTSGCILTTPFFNFGSHTWTKTMKRIPKLLYTIQHPYL